MCKRREVCVQGLVSQTAPLTVLAIQTQLAAKPLPDLSLDGDILTLLNRSNGTKESQQNIEGGGGDSKKLG